MPTLKERISESTASRSVVELDVTTGDRVHVYSEAIRKLTAEWAFGDSDEEFWIPVQDFWRAEPVMKSFAWPGDVQPDWIGRLIRESRWAYSSKFEYPRGIAWYSQGRAYVTAKFTLSLYDALYEVCSGSVGYSHLTRGWVIRTADLTSEAAFRELLDGHDIALSPEMAAALDGSTDWRLMLQEHVSSALDAGYRLPDTFPTERSLKPHQEQSVLALAGLGSGLLADPTGLGKGGSFINAFLSRVQYQLEQDPEYNPYPYVVVTNKSLVEEIIEEIVKWKGDAIIERLVGTTSVPIREDVQFVVLNVDLLAKRVDDIIEVRPKGFVTDEAHSLANLEANRTKAALQLIKYMRKSERRRGEHPYLYILSTGTPYKNQPSELWATLTLLGLDEWFSAYAMERLPKETMTVRTRFGNQERRITRRQAFEIRWCQGHYDYFGKWNSSGISNSAELHRLLLEKGMVRRRKSAVMDPLPPLYENPVAIEMDEEWADEYWRVEEEFATWMKEQAVQQAEAEGISKEEALRIVVAKLETSSQVMQMGKLRMIVGKAKVRGAKEWIHEFMAGRIHHKADSDHPEPWVEELGDDRRKLIVFAYHIDVIHALAHDPELAQYGTVALLQGEEHQTPKKAFQKDPNTRLIVCYSGAREGHTISAAKDLLLVELPYVPTWVIQMAGRCWARISEDFEPHEAWIHYLMAENTIDATSLRRIRVKKAKFNAVIDGESSEEAVAHEEQAMDPDLIMSMVVKGQRSMTIAI